MLEYVSLFTGAGGLDLGFRELLGQNDLAVCADGGSVQGLQVDAGLGGDGVVLHKPQYIDRYRVMAGAQQLEFGCSVQYPVAGDAELCDAFAHSFELVDKP